MARKKKTASTVRVNFKGIETRKTPPEGDCILEVLEVTNEVSKSSGGDQLTFTLEIAEGEYKGVKVWFYCPLAENSLWKLHAFLTALGVDAPEDEMDIDLSELVGNRVVGVLTHETYQGKKRAKMTDFDSVENYAGDRDDGKKKPGKKGKAEEEEDEPKGKSKKPAAKKGPAKVAKSDVEEMDRDELEELIESHSLDVDADDKKLKKDDKLLAAVLDALEEEDLLEEEEKKPAKKGKVKKLDRDEVEEMDADELQELIDAHDLDVDLDDHKKLPKKVAAVIEALEEADLLDD